MFFARVPVTPATRSSSGTDAVLRSTPTALTALSTTPSRVRARACWLTSCWYWPTPMALGSIFTSSASGSCRRRAMETAPRRETSMSGNSAAAISEAEYTDAPDSLTTTGVGRFPPASLMRSAISPASFSVSRDAVPLPTASRSTPCVAHRPASSWRAASQRFCGWCGYTMEVASTLPVGSTTAHFTPLRKPGSRPRVARCPAGAASRTSRRLVAKTSRAPSSAFSLRRMRTSRPEETASLVRQPKRTASASQRDSPTGRSKRSAIMPS